MKKVFTMFALFTLLAIFTGCASSGNGGVFKTTLVTNAVPTNVPVVTPISLVQTETNEVTNAQTGAVALQVQTVTNTVTVTNFVAATNVSVSTNYAVNPTVQTVLSGAGMVNTVTGPFNPFSGAIAAVLGLATAGLGYVARLKTNQAAKHASTITTIVQAVEGLAPAIAPAVKAAVAAKANNQGTTAQVAAAVNAVTQGIGTL